VSTKNNPKLVAGYPGQGEDDVTEATTRKDSQRMIITYLLKLARKFRKWLIFNFETYFIKVLFSIKMGTLLEATFIFSLLALYIS